MSETEAARKPTLKGFSYIYLSNSNHEPRPRRDMIKQKAAQSGIKLVGEFIDYGQSAGKAVFPKFAAMLSAVRERGDISAVVVPRLGHTHNRKQEPLTSYALYELGVVLVSATDALEPVQNDLLRNVAATFHFAQNFNLRLRYQRMTDAA
ncbi:MAG: recombinase family protein [Pseudonocardiaceae bacterium]